MGHPKAFFGIKARPPATDFADFLAITSSLLEEGL
jgi:hypothetical protein